MALSTSKISSARMKCVQRRVSPVNTFEGKCCNPPLLLPASAVSNCCDVQLARQMPWSTGQPPCASYLITIIYIFCKRRKKRYYPWYDYHWQACQVSCNLGSRFCGDNWVPCVACPSNVLNLAARTHNRVLQYAYTRLLLATHGNTVLTTKTSSPALHTARPRQ